MQNTISKYRIREKLQRSTRKRPIEKHQRKEKRNRTICTYPNVCVMLGGLQSQRLKCLKRKSNQIERRFQSIIRFFCKKMVWKRKAAAFREASEREKMDTRVEKGLIFGCFQNCLNNTNSEHDCTKTFLLPKIICGEFFKWLSSYTHQRRCQNVTALSLVRVWLRQDKRT